MEDFIKNCMCLVIEYDLELKPGSNTGMTRPVDALLGRSKILIEVVLSSTSSSLNGSSSTFSLNMTSESSMYS